MKYSNVAFRALKNREINKIMFKHPYTYSTNPVFYVTVYLSDFSAENLFA